MGAFNINITGVGGHGCERKAKPGEKLYGRCGRFNCPDCMAYEFVQQLKQKGMIRDGDNAFSIEVSADAPIPPGAARVDDVQGKRYAQFPHKAELTHWPGTTGQVVDNLLTNERKSGQF